MSGQDFANCEQTSVATASAPDQARAAIACIVRAGIRAEGLDSAATDVHEQALIEDLVRDLAQALGLIPTAPAIPPFRLGESGTAGAARRKALRDQAAPHATRDPEGRFTP